MKKVATILLFASLAVLTVLGLSFLQRATKTQESSYRRNITEIQKTSDSLANSDFTNLLGEHSGAELKTALAYYSDITFIVLDEDDDLMFRVIGEKDATNPVEYRTVSHSNLENLYLNKQSFGGTPNNYYVANTDRFTGMEAVADDPSGWVNLDKTNGAKVIIYRKCKTYALNNNGYDVNATEGTPVNTDSLAGYTIKTGIMDVSTLISCFSSSMPGYSYRIGSQIAYVVTFLESENRPGIYNPNDDQQCAALYGYLYNWRNSTNSSGSTTEVYVAVKKGNKGRWYLEIYPSWHHKSYASYSKFVQWQIKDAGGNIYPCLCSESGVKSLLSVYDESNSYTRYTTITVDGVVYNKDSGDSIRLDMISDHFYTVKVVDVSSGGFNITIKDTGLAPGSLIGDPVTSEDGTIIMQPAMTKDELNALIQSVRYVDSDNNIKRVTRVDNGVLFKPTYKVTSYSYYSGSTMGLELGMVTQITVDNVN